MSDNHTGLASQEEFQSKNWARFVENQSKAWALFYDFYLENYNRRQLHILKYESLKNDLIFELRHLMNFLDIRMNQKVEDCVILKKDGTNKRKKVGLDLKQYFTPKQQEYIDIIKFETFSKLEQLE